MFIHTPRRLAAKATKVTTTASRWVVASALTTWAAAATVLAAGLGSTALAAPNASNWAAQPTLVNFANADGLSIPAQLFVPAQAQGSAVVMLHGCSGVYYNGNISSIYREWADRLTAAGHVVLLVDSFTPRNAPNQCGNGGGVGVSEIFDRPKDAVAAAHYLAQAGLGVSAQRIGVLGWSHGGTTVLATLAATDPVAYTSPNPLAAGNPFKLGVAFYPGAKMADHRCGTVASTGGPKGCWKSFSDTQWDSYAPLTIHHGLADSITPYADADKRVQGAQAKAGGASVTLLPYTDAVHSFDDPNVGGGNCQPAAPNACAKLAADPAVLASFNQGL